MNARILVGVLSQENVPSCTLQGGQMLKGTISPSAQRLTGSLALAYALNADVYTGNYEVTPKVESQKLLTKQRFMTDDVNIHAIPYYEAGNNSGGNTVYIGNSLE